MKRPTREEVEREIVALDGLDTKALQVRWLEVYGKEPPSRIRAGLLRLGISYRLQEKAFGGLKPQTVRHLRKLAAELGAERASKQVGSDGTLAAAPHWPAERTLLSPGTQLMREWNGTTEVVDVASDGYTWRGGTYRTLSAVAVAITGTKWSGPKFFGLTGTAKDRVRAEGTMAPAPRRPAIHDMKAT
ncbi:DUF2924 domain-containing protein [Devosia sp.]|uniref:DUF2924 domain-containing protein n=1 Tax=Devosia sp. TaxID=1871048 RepID=UPI003BAC296A